MFQCQLQVLFYTRPPNSQLLYGQPGNTPLYWIFTSKPDLQAVSKSKSDCFWVTIKSFFMQYPQIANLYLANQKTDPFYGIFTSPYA